MTTESTDLNKQVRDMSALKYACKSQTQQIFNTWPKFHQAGLHHSDHFSELRKDPLEQKLRVFHSIKQEGTNHFNEGNYQTALARYQESLTIFRWVTSANKHWRVSGIDDNDLKVHTESLSGESAESAMTCYLNIALCNMKLSEWREALLACEEALKIYPVNVKALYRKASALILPPDANVNDYREAAGLLRKAEQLEPRNKVVYRKLQEINKVLQENSEPAVGQGVINQGEAMISHLKAKKLKRTLRTIKLQSEEMKETVLDSNCFGENDQLGLGLSLGVAGRRRECKTPLFPTVPKRRGDAGMNFYWNEEILFVVSFGIIFLLWGFIIYSEYL